MTLSPFEAVILWNLHVESRSRWSCSREAPLKVIPGQELFCGTDLLHWCGTSSENERRTSFTSSLSLSFCVEWIPRMEQLGRFPCRAVRHRRGVLLAQAQDCASASNGPRVRLHAAPLHRVPAGVDRALLPGRVQNRYFGGEGELVFVVAIWPVAPSAEDTFCFSTGGRSRPQR